LLRELDIKASTTQIENPRIKKKDRVFRTKRERKELKERKKIDKSLAEADAQVSFEEKERVQSEILKLVFLLYFRILKEVSDNALLSVVLEGIAQFARLINADFFGDLLEVIREIMERLDDLQVREELVCLNTAFTLLSNQGDSKVDLSHFVERFYELLPRIAASTGLFDRPSENELCLMELMVKIVDSIVFNPPTTPPPVRILKIYKRLLTCALQMEEKEATTCLKLVERIGRRFGKKVESLLDHEGAGIGDESTGRGVRAWELVLLPNHYGKGVAQLVKLLVKTEGKSL
jgi:nucleolar complex protein 3